jgi:23S rRNA (cytosine1962-C5)-methyltransferase
MARASDRPALAPAPARTAPVLVADDWRDYALIDSGEGMKLERYGPYTVIRPDSQAWWPRRLAKEQWRADAIFSGKDGEEMGRWQFIRRVPEAWPMHWPLPGAPAKGPGLAFHARCTPFRHLGVFPEQSVHWRWAAEQIRQAVRAPGSGPVRVLNLFGYTGLASLACSAAGAEVTHIDASKKAVAYGRENQDVAGLSQRPIRWIVEDALAFVEREGRRGNRYDGIILDPPKHGRGPGGEVFKLEEGLARLLAGCEAILSERALFMIATVYAVRLSFLALDNAMGAVLAGRGGRIVSGEMAIPEQDSPRLLPTAIFSRWEGGRQQAG